MKAITTFLFLLLFSFVSIGQEVFFDGMYVMDRDDGEKGAYYYRFYPSGQVMYVLTSSEDVNQVRSWLNLENINKHSNGFYFIEDNNIFMVLNTAFGSNLVRGSVEDKSLLLKTNFYSEGRVQGGKIISKYEYIEF
ncbi:hypothetical protein C9994_14800 [Marivirga lumbricoides]|uniref:Uncharacterized protein n=1 Tax=Marivirga lumbricoides TaxID=1046115 RepID=A0A2T4DDI3_9BACT|nr:hypothetical protein C9994_14800 [Marivirga lumbricoides]